MHLSVKEPHALSERDSSANSSASYSSAYSATETSNPDASTHNSSTATVVTTDNPNKEVVHDEFITHMIGRMKIDKKPAPEHNFGGTKSGKMRNIIEIDVLHIDGEEYKGNIREVEVHQLICREALRIKRSQILSVDFSWAGHPLVIVRIKDSVDIDRFPKHFSYNKPGRDKEGKVINHKVVCEIRGVKDESMEHFQRQEESADGPWQRWVKLEGVGFDLTEAQLREWLSNFGEVISDFETEVITFKDNIPKSDDDETTDKTVTLSSGVLSCKMVINEPIPQLLPAYGRRLKVYYRGIDKQCTKCFETDHKRSECTQSRPRLWIDYVCEFMEYFPKIQAKQYGKWFFQARAHKSTQNTSPTNGEVNKDRNT